MTDTVEPKSVRRTGFPWPGLPVRRIGASLAAVSALLGDALKMAHVDPYGSRDRPQAASDDDLDGRDPGW